MSAQQGGQATVGNLNAPTRCNAWPARSEDQTQYQNLKRLEGADKARAKLECPASHFIMASLVILQMSEEETIKTTREQTKHLMQ